MSRTAVVYKDHPDVAFDNTGYLWDVTVEPGPTCPAFDERNDVACRLPPDHDGEHLWFIRELVQQTGIRFVNPTTLRPYDDR